MKWGVRRTPEELGHKISNKTKVANLDKWGKSPDTNILYITGRSGSGKSSLAKRFSDQDTITIHLDLYFEGDDIEYENEYRSKEFDNFLKEKRVKTPGSIKSIGKAFGKACDKFEKALDEFGHKEFDNGRKVIAEGVQIADSGLFIDKTYYKNKPLIIIGTSNLTASYRAMKRDNTSIKFFINHLISKDKYANYLKDLEKNVDLSFGKNWLNQYFKETGK